MEIRNLYQKSPDRLSGLPDEVCECLAASGSVRIERIVSRGHCSEPGFWYDQNENEWVLLIQGEAGLRFRDDDRTVRLNPGDYLNIPAHAQHRIDWTWAEGETIWLVVFY